MAIASLLAGTAAQEAEFEVATVKPANRDQPVVAWLSYPGGRIAITNFTVNMLIEVAYDVSLYRIAGAPRWAGEEVYDITAKAPAGSPAAAFIPRSPTVVPSPESRAMMRSLLADRFGLKFHRETRDLPVYALTVAKRGPKLQAVRDPGAEPQSSIRRNGSREGIGAQNRDIPWLAAVLEPSVRQTILDRTGLTGRYDFDLKLELRPHYASGADAPLDPAVVIDTALETQLGLTLKRTKGAVEILVIDAVRRPSPN